MSEIGWWKRARREEDDDWLAKGVGGVDGNIEGRVVAAALCTLHPIDNAGTVGIGGAGAADRDAWIA